MRAVVEKIVSAANGCVPVRPFVHDDAEAENIGPRIRLPPLDLFRREVLRRAEQEARQRRELLPIGRTIIARETKIEHL